MVAIMCGSIYVYVFMCCLECVCVIFHRTSSQCLPGSVFWAPCVWVWMRQWPSQSQVSRVQGSAGSSWESQSAPVLLVGGDENHKSDWRIQINAGVKSGTLSVTQSHQIWTESEKSITSCISCWDTFYELITWFEVRQSFFPNLR